MKRLLKLFQDHPELKLVLACAGLLLTLSLAVILIFPPPTRSVELEGRLWGAYSDNPSTKEHGVNYFVHTDDGNEYALEAEDVSHIPVGSRVRLEGQYPYGLHAAAALLDVPRVNVVQPAPAVEVKNGGVQKWLAVICKYADHPEQQYDQEFIRGLMSTQAPGMSDYWGRVSNRKLIFDGRKVVGPYTVGLKHFELWKVWDDDPAKRIFDVGRLGNACAKQAEADPSQKLKLSDYDGIIFFLNFEMDGTAKGGTMYLDTGKTQKLMRAAWIPFWKDGMSATTAHEIGHGEEFGHSSDARSIKDGTLGNPWDVMGDIWIFCQNQWSKTYGCIPQYPAAYWRAKNGWINVARADYKTGVKSFHIMPADSDTDGPQALYVPVTENAGYMIEVRRPTGDYESKLPHDEGGALLSWVAPGNKYPITLIDMNGDGNDNPDDGSPLIRAGARMGSDNGITLCFLADEDDGGMTIAVGKQKAHCDEA